MNITSYNDFLSLFSFIYLVDWSARVTSSCVWLARKRLLLQLFSPLKFYGFNGIVLMEMDNRLIAIYFHCYHIHILFQVSNSSFSLHFKLFFVFFLSFNTKLNISFSNFPIMNNHQLFFESLFSQSQRYTIPMIFSPIARFFKKFPIEFVFQLVCFTCLLATCRKYFRGIRNDWFVYGLVLFGWLGFLVVDKRTLFLIIVRVCGWPFACSFRPKSACHFSVLLIRKEEIKGGWTTSKYFIFWWNYKVLDDFKLLW